MRGERAALREGKAPAPALVVVSRTANLPLKLTVPSEQEGDGEVLLVTCGAAEDAALAAAREALGEEHVLVVGEEDVDLTSMVGHLVERGMPRMLTEGGPRLLRDMAAAGLVDEVCLTVVPHLIAGEHPRILTGHGVAVALAPRLLLEAEGSLLGRWVASVGG